MTLHEDMAAAAAEAARVVGGVRADQFTAPTPCADWDVHALLNHTILGRRSPRNAARGTSRSRTT